MPMELILAVVVGWFVVQITGVALLTAFSVAKDWIDQIPARWR